MAAVKIRREIVQDVHLDAAHRVLVEGVPADAHDHGEDGGLGADGGAGREAREAVVDARRDGGVSADGEAGEGDVGCGDAELREGVSIVFYCEAAAESGCY